MKDIDNKKYSSRKEYEYDDDIGVLFYDGNRVARTEAEDYRKSWIEESWNDEDGSVYTLFDDLGLDTSLLMDQDGNLYNDALEDWEKIWDELDWDEKSKSYKYKKWTLIILDI